MNIKENANFPCKLVVYFNDLLYFIVNIERKFTFIVTLQQEYTI